MSVSTGKIVHKDTEIGMIEVSDTLGTMIKYTILPSCLFYTDGNHIHIDELRPGDQVVINKTGSR